MHTTDPAQEERKGITSDGERGTTEDAQAVEEAERELDQLDIADLGQDDGKGTASDVGKDEERLGLPNFTSLNTDEGMKRSRSMRIKGSIRSLRSHNAIFNTAAGGSSSQVSKGVQVG